MSDATVTPAALAVTTTRPAVTVRSSGVIIPRAVLAVTTTRPAVTVTAIRKSIVFAAIATRGAVTSGVTASYSLTAAPDTNSSLAAAATTGEGGP